MKIAEDFDRCAKCDGAIFIPVTKVLIRKGSEKDNPDVYEKSIHYTCETCGKVGYERRVI